MYRKIYVFKSSAEAGMLIALLRGNKFHPLELQTASHASIAGADIFYYVQIPEAEYNSAKNFLVNQGYNDVL